MVRYLSIRLGETLIAIWGVVTIIFVVARLGGDPAVLMLPIGATDEELAAFRAAEGLDRPMWVQYLDFIGNIVLGDFGNSLLHGSKAFDVVMERMPATIELALLSLFLGTLLGGGLGIIAAVKRGSIFDSAAMVLALLGQATPVYWLGLMLIMFFAVRLDWLPAGGYGTFSHLIMPAITLAVFVAASIARLLRSSLLDTLKEDYVRTAWAKGLAPSVVYIYHAVRNSLIPVVTMIGILAGELLGGTVVTETVFAWPGVGRLIVHSILNNDFPVVQAGIFLVACIFLLSNLIVDLLYGVLDPRVRISR